MGPKANGPRDGHMRQLDPAAQPEGVLGAAQVDYLTFLVQEEKMARDLYTAFADIYGTRIFTNIARSEQQHMDAVSTLLGVYGEEDVTDGLDAGQFADPALQALYDDLLTQGSDSLSEALAAGVTVEQTDIADLQDADEALSGDVQRVLDGLLAGSQRHLAAFSR